MVAQFSSNSSANAPQSLNPLQQRLLAGLTTLLEDISLCLLDGNKKPHGAGWQNKPLTKVEVTDAIINGITLRNLKGEDYHLKATKIKGFGIITGTPLTVKGEKYFVVAVDQDGPSAGEKVTELSGGIGLPKTVAFTSKREGRCQYLFLIPEVYAPNLQTKKLITQPKTETQELEQLEFRWTGLQSVLPPSVHPQTGEYAYVEGCAFGGIEIAIAPDWVIEQMLADKTPSPTPIPTIEATPKPMQTTQPKPKTQWSDRDWALSFLEALSPSRVDSYDDWLKVGMALHSIGDDSLLYDWDAWSQRSTKYKPGGCEKKWESFGKRGGITLATLGLMAKNDGWRSPFEKPSERNFTGGIGSGSGGSGGNGNNRGGTGGNGGNGGDDGDGNNGDDNGNVVKLPTFYLISEAELEAEIEKLIAQSLPESKVTSIINRLAFHSQRSPIEVRKQYQERLSEAQIELERQDNLEWVNRLIQIGENDLNLSDYLPLTLAEALTQWCNWLSINQSVVLTALLTGASSLHKVGTELILHPAINFRVPPTTFGAIVGESGQKKSPIFANIIRNPLQVLRQEKMDAYLAAMEKHKAAVLAWTNADDKKTRGEKPEPPPPPTLYFFSNATGEAISVQAAKDPSKALLGLIDELSGYFNSADVYRKGKGSDKQDMLSYFDATGQTVLRVDGVRADVFKIHLSIFGTIQPEVLKTYMGDCTDRDGKHARFLFVNQPLKASTLPPDDGMCFQIGGRIADFYKRIDNLPEMEYRLSREAFNLYKPTYDQLERLRVKSKPGMAAVYSKMEGYVGRLALNLHVLGELAEGKACPSEEISAEVMAKAIQLAKFYVGQVELIHTDSDEESVPAHLTKMISLSKRLQTVGDKSQGWLKAKHISDQYSAKKRPKAATIYSWMQEAVVMGLGSVRGTGNRMEFHWMPQGGNDSTDGGGTPTDSPPDGNFRNVRNTLGSLTNDVPKAENVESKGIEDNFRNFRNFRNDFSPPEKSTHTPPVENTSPPTELTHPTQDVEIPPPENAKISLEGEIVPKVSLSTPDDASNVDVASDTDFRNDSRKGFLQLPKVPKADESQLVLREVVDAMNQCTTQNDVKALYALHPTETIEAAKELMDDEERLNFEAIVSECATGAQAQIITNDASEPEKFNPTTDLNEDEYEEYLAWSIELEEKWLALRNDDARWQTFCDELEATYESEELGIEYGEENEYPTPNTSPTLSELKALLLVCESLTALNALNAKHSERISDAYRTMTEDEQIRIDGLTIGQYPESTPIYKVVGTGITRYSPKDNVTLTVGKGDLVTVVREDACLAYVKKLGTMWLETLAINPKSLREVPRR